MPRYGIHLFDETQVLVDAGYAVVYCNPRGSAGYGRAHGRSIRQAMGTVDFADVIDFLEGAVAADASLDGDARRHHGRLVRRLPHRVDDRARPPLRRRDRGARLPRPDLASRARATSARSSATSTSASTADAIARQSPMAVVGQVTTPTLVIHSELDFRCPLEQATRYYSALKRQGTEAELLVFPGENHELTAVRAAAPPRRAVRGRPRLVGAAAARRADAATTKKRPGTRSGALRRVSDQRSLLAEREGADDLDDAEDDERDARGSTTAPRRPRAALKSRKIPAMMLMIAKKIVQPFDAASPSVESETMPSTIHMMPTRMPMNDREPRGGRTAGSRTRRCRR